MSDTIIHDSLLSFIKYYEDHMDMDDLNIPPMSTALRKAIMRLCPDPTRISDTLWLYLNSARSRRAMLIAAIGWCLSHSGYSVTYGYRESSFGLLFEGTWYTLETTDPCNLSPTDVVDSDTFFRNELIDHPEDVDFIAAYTIAKRLPLYYYDPNL